MTTAQWGQVEALADDTGATAIYDGHTYLSKGHGLVSPLQSHAG